MTAAPWSQSNVGRQVTSQIASLQGQLSATNQLIATQTALTIAQLQATPIAAFAATLPVLVAPGVIKTFIRTTGPLAAPVAPALDYRAYISFQTLDGAYWLLAREFDVDSRIFGAKWDFNAGTKTGTDDWQALQMCADYIGTRGTTPDRIGVLYVGGYSLVSQALVIRYNRVGIRGDGQGDSIIAANSDLGDIILVSSADPTTTQVSGFSLKDITIRQYFAATTGGACLKNVRVVGSVVSNVQFSNHFSGNVIIGGSQQYYSNFGIRTGSLWAGNVSGTFMFRTWPGDPSWNGGILPNEIFVDNFSWDGDFTPGANPTIGNVERGIDYRCGDGVWLNNGHCFGTFSADCWIEPYSTTTQCDGLRCVNVWFDNNSINGLVMAGTTDVNTLYGDFQFTNCKWLGSSANSYNVYIKSDCTANGITFTGCHVDNAGLSNVNLLGPVRNLSIIGGKITGAGKAGVGTDQYGISMTGTMTNILFSDIIFDNNAVGIFIRGGAPDFVTIGPCVYRGGIASVRDSTVTKRKFYADPASESESFWQNILQSSNILQLPASGSYFECAATASLVNDMICRWNKRQVTIKVASSVTFVHGAGVLQTISGSNVSLTSGQMITFLYTGSYWQQI